MPNYERFGNESDSNTNDAKPSTSASGAAEIKDVQIEVEKTDEDGKVTFYKSDDKKKAEYIADPAGDPFAPKTGIE